MTQYITMSDAPLTGRIAYLISALGLEGVLAVLLLYSNYFRWKFSYAMILVGLLMLFISLFMGGLGIVLSIRARSRGEPVGIWLVSTILAFTPAAVYALLVVRQL
jgi:hypothetical protein